MAIRLIAGRYAVLHEAPRPGGSAEVYKARDMFGANQPIVAAKIFHSPSLNNKVIQELFLRETDALKVLRHENIVTMLDSGFDRESGAYIILEWLDKSLPAYLNSNPPSSWEAFADAIVIPLLEALAHAHSCRIIHRDVKPDNILVSADAQPKLADFSIAKLLGSLRIGMTVHQFGTPAFTAPERGRDQPHAREDVFAVGMTILSCLMPKDFALSHSSIQTALNVITLPLEIKEFVAKLVSLDPLLRPFNAEVALRQLQRIHQPRPPSSKSLPTYYLAMGRVSRSRLTQQFGCASHELDGMLTNDLSAQTYIDVPRDSRGDEGEYWLMGTNLSFRVRVREQTGDQLLIDSVSQPPPYLHERRRSDAFPLPANWSFRAPPAPDRSADELDVLCQRVTELVAERNVLKAQAKQNSLYQEWESILSAKYDLERLREAEISYRTISRKQDNAVEFILHRPPSEDLTGQERRVRSDEHISGYVSDVTGSRIIFIVTKGAIDAIPFAGSLYVDRDLSTFAIRRQRDALNLLRGRQSLRSDLGDLLTRPEEARYEPIHDHLKPVQEDLDDAKWQAIHVALSSPDLSTVEGPPGTGKTTWIAEMVCQFIDRNPKARILLSGQTHISVDHALAKVHNLRPTMRVCRIRRDDQVSPQVEPLLYRSQLAEWRQDAHARATRYLQELAANLGIAPSRLYLIRLVEELASAEANAARTQERLNKTNSESPAGDKDLPAPDLPSTRLDRKKRHRMAHKKITIDQEEADAAAQADADVRRLRARIANSLRKPDVAIASMDDIRASAGTADDSDTGEQRLARLSRIEAEWHRRFGTGKGFEDAFLFECKVVAGTCLGIANAGRDIGLTYDLVVLDEASKATPTEALVPMVKGKRWILVGDQKQLPPFTDDDLARSELLGKHALTQEALQRTLFDRLISLLPSHSKTVLSEQHRMAAPIGSMISECFYEKALRSSGEVNIHPVVHKVIPRPITWFSTSALPDRFESKRPQTPTAGDSTFNRCEAREVLLWLRQLEAAARRHSRTFTVGVLSGYAAQKEELSKQLRRNDTNRWQRLDLDIDTIDAFQGREVDIVVLSVTRSNSRNELGHMISVSRVNVALSRGKFAVAIFGDSDMCYRSAASSAPLMTVLDYIARNPGECRLERLSKQ